MYEWLVIRSISKFQEKTYRFSTSSDCYLVQQDCSYFIFASLHKNQIAWYKHQTADFLLKSFCGAFECLSFSESLEENEEFSCT
jgi:hypothetical protein